MLAGPETRTVDGAVFAESRMAEHLGEDTVLVDVGSGPTAIADGLAEAAARARAPTSWSSSTSAETCSATGPSPVSRARCATPSCWPPARCCSGGG